MAAGRRGRGGGMVRSRQRRGGGALRGVGGAAMGLCAAPAMASPDPVAPPDLVGVTTAARQWGSTRPATGSVGAGALGRWQKVYAPLEDVRWFWRPSLLYVVEAACLSVFASFPFN
uniref:Uncharacterized protein n=1 Tax=Oryza nivara TaxID=4536 RepID=A0A0E0HNM4_ORYNI